MGENISSTIFARRCRITKNRAFRKAYKLCSAVGCQHRLRPTKRPSIPYSLAGAVRCQSLGFARTQPTPARGANYSEDYDRPRRASPTPGPARRCYTVRDTAMTPLSRPAVRRSRFPQHTRVSTGRGHPKFSFKNEVTREGNSSTLTQIRANSSGTLSCLAHTHKHSRSTPAHHLSSRPKTCLSVSKLPRNIHSTYTPEGRARRAEHPPEAHLPGHSPRTRGDAPAAPPRRAN